MKSTQENDFTKNHFREVDWPWKMHFPNYTREKLRVFCEHSSRNTHTHTHLLPYQTTKNWFSRNNFLLICCHIKQQKTDFQGKMIFHRFSSVIKWPKFALSILTVDMHCYVYWQLFLFLLPENYRASWCCIVSWPKTNRGILHVHDSLSIMHIHQFEWFLTNLAVCFDRRVTGMVQDVTQTTGMYSRLSH